MSGSLREVRPGVWKVRVYVGQDRHKRDQYRSKTFPAASERAAKKAMHQHVAAILAERDQEAERRGTLNELVDEWVDFKADLSPTSIASHRMMVRRIRERLGHIPLDKLSARDIDSFYTWLRRTKFNGRHLSESTIHHHHRILRGILRQGNRWDMIATIPTSKVTAPRQPHIELHVPTLEDIARVLAIAPPMLRAMALFAAGTGLRRGELAAIRWTDINGPLLTVSSAIIEAPGQLVEKSPKSRKSRRVVLSPDVMNMLNVYRPSLEATAPNLNIRARVFPALHVDPTGLAPIRPGTISHAWRRIAAKAGVTCRFHDLRHWHASELIARGVPLPQVQRQLGHSKMSTTSDIYVHATESDDIGAALTGVLPALPS